MIDQCDYYLREFYRRRFEGCPVCLLDDDDDDVKYSEYARACRRLQKLGLIKWIPIMGLPIGFGEITAAGIQSNERTSGTY
jgi:hypothetical protein